MSSTFSETGSTRKCQFLSTISNVIVGTLESGFYYYGSAISKHPFITIFFCLVLTGVTSIGFIKYETDESELQFMSTNSMFHEVLEWQERNFPSLTNQQTIIFEADNVLDKQVLLEIFNIRQQIINITVGNLTWETVCAKGLVYQACDAKGQSKHENYCAMQESMERVCREESIFQVWNYDMDLLSSRSQEDIITDINSSPDITTVPPRYLGRPEKNFSGPIEEAKATMHTWYTDASDKEQSLKWEQEFSNLVSKLPGNDSAVSIYYSTSSSFGKIVSKDIQEDLKYLFLGFLLVLVYVTVNLSKCNLIEQRPVLSVLGLSCVGLATVVSYGLSSAFGIPFGAINSILPFLLLGLGIDDMFVILTAFENLSDEDQCKELHERIGLTMRHAGVSITVTSVTDLLAFVIGSTTVLPALRSFCLYAAIGITAIYFFQATFFVACLSLDQRRLEDIRHGCFWCWKLENWIPDECSDLEFCKAFFMKVYAIHLVEFKTKIVVLLFTLLLFGLSCWGVSNLRQDFDPMWFLPPESSLARFLNRVNVHYPSFGVFGAVYFGNVSYLELAKLKNVVGQMHESAFITRVDSWFENYEKYHVDKNSYVNVVNQTESEFMKQLSGFLYSCEGSKYLKSNFRFNSTPDCTNELPPIVASSIEYMHTQVNGTDEKMSAIENIMSIVESQNFNGFVFPFSQAYINWETNYIIGKELLQNMGLALAAVFLVSLILLASVPLSLLVMLCVLMTLVDVGALMHWWGLTIDTISAIDLVLAIGLSVDYAVHIAHTFMTVTGTRNERAQATVGTIGPAVFNGGFSTFLSFLLLANSDSYVFRTFFKIFFAVCLYGVYHGLVFLPVLLSWLGPAPYASARPSSVIPGFRGPTQVMPPPIVPHL